jgi:phosphate:Na+ symporter
VVRKKSSFNRSRARFFTFFLSFFLYFSGAVITVMVQASSATVAIVSALAQQKLVTMQLAVAVVLGASNETEQKPLLFFCFFLPLLIIDSFFSDIGTTGASLLTSIGKSRSALRVAVAYVMQKFVGVCIVLPLLGSFVSLTLSLSPNATVPRQVANSHTFFNVVVALVCFFPHCSSFAFLFCFHSCLIQYSS